MKCRIYAYGIGGTVTQHAAFSRIPTVGEYVYLRLDVNAARTLGNGYGVETNAVVLVRDVALFANPADDHIDIFVESAYDADIFADVVSSETWQTKLARYGSRGDAV